MKSAKNGKTKDGGNAASPTISYQPEHGGVVPSLTDEQRMRIPPTVRRLCGQGMGISGYHATKPPFKAVPV
jgi:hypothetical protein